MFVRVCLVHGAAITLPVIVLYGSNPSFGIQSHSIIEGLCGKGSSKICRLIEILAECATT
jgi:hypothetical protein